MILRKVSKLAVRSIAKRIDNGSGVRAYSAPKEEGFGCLLYQHTEAIEDGARAMGLAPTAKWRGVAAVEHVVSTTPRDKAVRGNLGYASDQTG